jgi:hypothetical protein
MNPVTSDKQIGWRCFPTLFSELGSRLSALGCLGPERAAPCQPDTRRTRSSYRNARFPLSRYGPETPRGRFSAVEAPVRVQVHSWHGGCFVG